MNLIEETREQQDKRWPGGVRRVWHVHSLGLYSLAAGIWKGECVPGTGEWIQQRARIPIKEYE